MDVSDTIGLLVKSLGVEEELPLRSKRLAVTKDVESFARQSQDLIRRGKEKRKHTL